MVSGCTQIEYPVSFKISIIFGLSSVCTALLKGIVRFEENSKWQKASVDGNCFPYGECFFSNALFANFDEQ